MQDGGEGKGERLQRKKEEAFFGLPTPFLSLLCLAENYVNNKMNKRGKFLKKLWRCVGGVHYNIIWFFNWADDVNWLPLRDLEAYVSSVSPSSERSEELCVVCGLYT